MKVVWLLAAMTAAAVHAAVSSAQAEPVLLQMGAGLPADHTSTKALEWFAAEAARRSHNSLKVELGPEARFGSPAEVIQKVRSGSMFGVWVGVSYFARLVPEMEALNLPFVFRNYDDIWRTVDGPVGKLIQSKVEAKGFVVLAWMELGARNVENAKRPLKTLDDFKGVKIWVSPAETFQATFRALGATPMITPTNEINGLIEHGDLDGIELPYSLMTGNKHYQKTKYVSDTNHVLDLIVFVTSKNTLSRLTPEQQKIIRDVAKIAAVQQRKMSEDADAAALQFLKDAGQQFDPVSPEMRAAMRKATAGVIAKLKASIGAELVDKAIAEADRRTANAAVQKRQ